MSGLHKDFKDKANQKISRLFAIHKPKEDDSIAIESSDKFWNDIMGGRLARKIIWAESAASKKDWEESINRFDSIVKEFSTFTPVAIWIRLSTLHRNMGRFSRATKVTNRALKLYPQNMDLEIELADIAMGQKKWAQAIVLWNNIINEGPSDKPQLTPSKRLLTAYVNNQNYNQAQALANDLIKVFPAESDLLFLNAEISMAQDNWEKAEDRINRACKSSENFDAQYWIDQIKIQRKLNNTDKADELATKALRQSPDIRIRVEWADIPTNNNDWQEAFKRWNLLQQQFGDAKWVDDWVKLSISFNSSVLDKILKIDKYVSDIKKYRSSKKTRNIAIVTAYSRGYDVLKIPTFIDDRIDYIAYTDDDKADGFGVYDIRPLPYPDLDGPRSIRYVKTHPHVLLKQYDIVVWVDTSFLITDNIYPLIQRFQKSGLAIGSTPHQIRSSIQDEAEACIDLNKENPDVLTKQVEDYTNDGFDGKILAENGILMFNRKSKKLGPVLETWWTEILNRGKRDQISFGYSLYKNGAEWHHIVDKPYNMRNMPGFVLRPHKTDSVSLDKLYNLLREKLS